MEFNQTQNKIPFQKKIVQSLQQIGVEKVILFGSYAIGTKHPDSDIDLLVVTNDPFTPSSFKEKMKVKLKIAQALSFVREKHPLDLIVFTHPMYQQFLHLNSAFQREINSTGIVLYEKYYTGMA